ncbi:MAG TPA: hypothetical protein VF995_02695 [Actinomycetota bacterium]
MRTHNLHACHLTPLRPASPEQVRKGEEFHACRTVPSYSQDRNHAGFSRFEHLVPSGCLLDMVASNGLVDVVARVLDVVASGRLQYLVASGRVVDVVLSWGFLD